MTRASRERLSQRKLSQPRIVPMARPAAQRLWRRIAAIAAAAKPKSRVSQEMRRSVWAPAMESGTLLNLADWRDPASEEKRRQACRTPCDAVKLVKPNCFHCLREGGEELRGRRQRIRSRPG